MGTFQGHALPGIFFILFAIWWTSQITKRLLICNTKRIPFYNSITFPCFIGRFLIWPTEGVIKIVATGIGMVLELLAATDFGKAGRVVYFGDLQHMTMYLFFFLSGITDILQSKYAWVPKAFDYLACALGFGVESILFFFHINGRSTLDMHIHTLLLYAVLGCLLSVLLEMYQTNSPLVAFSRAYFVFLQGTWFIQIGFILYNPIYGSKKWDEDSPKQCMYATLLFCWHAGAVLVVQGVVVALHRVAVLVCCYPRRHDLEWQITREDYQTISPDHSHLHQTGEGTSVALNDNEEDTALVIVSSEDEYAQGDS